MSQIVIRRYDAETLGTALLLATVVGGALAAATTTALLPAKERT